MLRKIYKPEGFSLGSGTEGLYTASALEKAMTKGQILEARATVCDEEISLYVDLGCMRGTIKKEEVAFNPDGSPVKDIAAITRVGKTVCFKVCGFEKRRGETVAILSRKDAQRDCLENYLMQLLPGDIVDARVTHLEPFGAFVDVGCGIVSLLSIDCISVSRIAHPRDRFYPGMAIKTAVKAIDYDLMRISVTHKELLGTWKENAEKFRIGQTVPGIVRSIEPYGIFVELSPNLAGLAEYSENVRIGDRATVYIKNIIPEKMKIKLVLIDTYQCESELYPPEYFVFSDHIESWDYSPEECPKYIGTEFR